MNYYDYGKRVVDFIIKNSLVNAETENLLIWDDEVYEKIGSLIATFEKERAEIPANNKII